MKKILIAFSAITALLIPTPANAADTGYRYWGYFQAGPGAQQWSAAMTGPTVDVADGSVEGWIFTFSGDDVPDASSPKIKPNFSSICGKTQTVSGKKRIGLVIDFGTSAIRPKGEKIQKAITKCVIVDKQAQGIDVLGAVAKIRSNSSGLICGLNGYPAKECGALIPTPLKLKK